MTYRTSRSSRLTRVFVAGMASLLVAGSFGCDLLNQAQEVLNAAQILSDFANRLEKGRTLTYTAKYQVTGGHEVTYAQQPPKEAFIAKSARFIVTEQFVYLCAEDNGKMTCQKAVNTSPSAGPEAGTANAGLIAGVTGPAFVPPEVALGLILAASVIPGAKVSKSDKTIAGQASLCANATGLDAAASPGDKDAPKDFSVCVTEAGVLASFSGTSAEGEKVSIELTNYSTSVDPSSFEPPAGATIVNVDEVHPPS